MFKYKPNKVKFLTNVKTLDETHQKTISAFEKRQKGLDELKKKYDEKKKLLNDEKNNNKLKDECLKLNERIKKIEQEEVDYYSKTSELLLDYYDITEASNYNVEKMDKLSILNEKSQKDRKVKKISKKRIKNMNDMCKKKTIFDYLNIDKTKEEVNNRATLLKSYNNIIHGKYGKKTFIKMCPNCGVEEMLIHAESVYVCPECGNSENVIIETELTSYKDVGCEKPAYPYKRINHLIECLNQFQAKESVDIPLDIYEKIVKEIEKHRYTKNELSFSIMKSLLKKLHLHQYYEHIPHIISKITQKSAPIISRDVEEKIKSMFRQIQEPFSKYCPNERKNFLSYSYILHKFFEILKMDVFAEYFPLLKSCEKLRIQDQIWKKICYDLNYPFYSSFDKK
jgi:predicted RNA-binding Zn-ribbon protein involved in translation (DUF1610 family)